MHLTPRILLPGLLLLAVGSAPVLAEKPHREGPRPWRKAFHRALKDKETWIPAAAGAAIMLSGQDRAISNWAQERAPVFGSPAAALKASDDLRHAGDLTMLGTSMWLSHSAGGSSSFQGRTLYTGVGYAGAIVATSWSDILKEASGRPRPNGGDTRSFPSGHATRVFAYSGFTNRSIAQSDLPRGAKIGLRVTSTGLAAGTAWARVEAGVHYPSDVLFGAALGNLFGKFAGEWLLGPDSETQLSFDFNPDRPQVTLAWSF